MYDTSRKKKVGLCYKWIEFRNNDTPWKLGYMKKLVLISMMMYIIHKWVILVTQLDISWKCLENILILRYTQSWTCFSNENIQKASHKSFGIINTDVKKTKRIFRKLVEKIYRGAQYRISIVEIITFASSLWNIYVPDSPVGWQVMIFK